MLPISPPNFLAQTCKRVAGALANGENIVRAAEQIEKNSFICFLHAIIGRDQPDYTTEAEGSFRFAINFIENFLKVALLPGQSELTVYEDVERKFVLRNSDIDGEVQFIEITCIREFSLFNSSEPKKSEEILYAAEIDELMDVFENTFRENSLTEKNEKLCTLLHNNGEIFSSYNSLAKNDAYQRELPLARLAKQYYWNKEYVNSTRDYRKPNFPIPFSSIECEKTFISPQLETFFRDGTLPNSNVEKTQLLWKCFQIKLGNFNRDWCNSYLSNSPMEARLLHEEIKYCCQFILENIQHLDFTQFEALSKDNYYDFILFFDYLRTHYKGNAISFAKIADRQSKISLISNELVLSSIGSLIVGNPNLTSVGFSNCELNCYSLESYIMENDSITTLTFKMCVFVSPYAYKFDWLGILLQKKSAVREINLWGNKISGPEKVLFEELKENTTLTSFNTDIWETDEQKAQCEQYLKRNRELIYSYKNLMVIKEFEKMSDILLPEIFKLIYDQLVNLNCYDQQK